MTSIHYGFAWLSGVWWEWYLLSSTWISPVSFLFYETDVYVVESLRVHRRLLILYHPLWRCLPYVKPHLKPYFQASKLVFWSWRSEADGLCLLSVSYKQGEFFSKQEKAPFEQCFFLLLEWNMEGSNAVLLCICGCIWAKNFWAFGHPEEEHFLVLCLLAVQSNNQIFAGVQTHAKFKNNVRNVSFLFLFPFAFPIPFN